MTTDMFRATLRPLVLTIVWFAFLAAAAFAWAAIEGEKAPQSPPNPTVLVAR